MESKAIEAKLDTLIGLMTKEATPAPQPVVTPPRRPPEPVPANGPPLAGDEETLYQRFKARLVAEAPSVLRLLTTQPELQVEIEKHVVKISETSPEGRIAKLIAEGFFQDRVSEPAVFAELLRRGHVTMKTPKIRVHDPLKRLVKKGFLTREGDGYQAVRGMEVNLVEKD